MLRALADWWDGVELWVTQLPFPLQVVLAVVVVLPLCAAAAVALDRLVEVALTRPRRRRPAGRR